MIKDKLHTISDADAQKVGEILLKSSTSRMFDFSFEKITRQKYDNQHGVDAEESVNVYFIATVKDEEYKKSGWKDKKIFISLVERDRYIDYPYFSACDMTENSGIWKNSFLSNHIEAVEYLQNINLL